MDNGTLAIGLRNKIKIVKTGRTFGLVADVSLVRDGYFPRVEIEGGFFSRDAADEARDRWVDALAFPE